MVIYVYKPCSGEVGTRGSGFKVILITHWATTKTQSCTNHNSFLRLGLTMWPAFCNFSGVPRTSIYSPPDSKALQQTNETILPKSSLERRQVHCRHCIVEELLTQDTPKSLCGTGVDSQGLHPYSSLLHSQAAAVVPASLLLLTMVSACVTLGRSPVNLAG